MPDNTGSQKMIKRHKLIAVVMGTLVVFVIIRHLWQEGLGNLMSELSQSLK